MSTMLDRPETTRPEEGAPRRGALRMPELWGAVAIACMWLAVLFTARYGGDFTSVNAGSQATTIPSAVFVALFACIGSISVAKRAFRRDAE
jgi:hypothetical protein